jgi:hypothetical protein
MCCFAGEVESVSDTKIFARIAPNGDQWLIYSMAYRSKTLNAMILPLPVAKGAGDQAVEFPIPTPWKNFFFDLENAFPQLRTWADLLPKKIETSVDARTDSRTLEVHDLGTAIASYVPSQKDFDRIDPQFRIAPAIWKQIPQYEDYGFAVIQLKSLEAELLPVVMRFPSRDPKKIFFPTLHIHDGQVHPTEQFDHWLYTQEPLFDRYCGQYLGPNALDSTTGWIRSAQPLARTIQTKSYGESLEPRLLVHRQRLIGELPNEDHWLEAKAATLEPLWNQWRTRRLPWGILTGAGIAGLLWFLYRREEIQRQKQLPTDSPSELP